MFVGEKARGGELETFAGKRLLNASYSFAAMRLALSSSYLAKADLRQASASGTELE